MNFKARFSWLNTFISFWIIVGLILDNWAHRYHYAGGGETVFTIWHFAIYAGLFMAAFSIVVIRLKNRRLPQDFSTISLGLLLFGVAAICDIVWHSIFGFESSLDGFYSPPHLLIAASVVLIIVGPIRADLSCPNLSYPGIFAISFVVIEGTLLFSQMHPFIFLSITKSSSTLDLESKFVYQAVGLSGLLINISIIIVATLLTVKKWKKEGSLPKGCFTIVFTLQGLTAAFTGNHLELTAVALVVGVIADLLVFYKISIRVWSFCIPVLYQTAYFIFVSICEVDNITWTLHLISGVTIASGLLGLGFSFIIFPPDQKLTQTQLP